MDLKYTQEPGAPLPRRAQPDRLCVFAGVCALLWVLGDVCQLPGRLLEISRSQGVCSGQLLSAKNGRSVAELLCAGVAAHLSIK